MSLDTVFGSLAGLVTSPTLMGLLLLAIPIGMFFGAVPGLGGKLGIVLLIPFVFGMDMTAGAVFLLAMHAVVHTGGSVPSILFGVPGTGPDAATIVDGYPMAQKGEAGRALGASLGASGLGGVIGAIVLALLLPVLKPVVLSFSPAEFFLLAILGITFIASLSGNSLIKGVAVGAFGLMIAFVGMDPQTGVARYAFGHLFLWDGVDIITAILAMFAVPEMIALGVKGGSVSAVTREAANYSVRDVLGGIADVFRHWKLALRTSVIGSLIGVIPGLGGDAASWICYGHAVQSSKTPERFGKGAVEGVIAPETANNSKEGGSLLPTLFFGVPGSSGMAVLLGALIMLGIQPGPQLLLQHLDLVWTLIWALVIANVLAVVMFLGIARWVGLLAFIRGSLLIPFVFVLAPLGSYLSEGHWQNLVLIVVFGLLGYALKRFDWPRPPFVIGLVLGPIAEVSLHQALSLWGIGFLLRPLSIVFVLLIIGSIAFYLRRRRYRRAEAPAAAGPRSITIDGRVATSAVMLSIFAVMVAMSAGYPAQSRFLPLIVGIPGILLCLAQLTIDIRRPRDADESLYEGRMLLRREVALFAWLTCFVGTVLLFGFLAATPVMIFAFLRFSERESLRLSAILAIASVSGLYVIFDLIMELPLLEGVVTGWLFATMTPL